MTRQEDAREVADAFAGLSVDEGLRMADRIAMGMKERARENARKWPSAPIPFSVGDVLWLCDSYEYLRRAAGGVQ